MRFSGYFVADYGGNLLIICQPGKPAGADSIFRRLPAYFFLRVGWTHVGYSVGVKAIDKVRENSQMIARSATILGITVIGGLIASYVHINVVTSFAIDSTHSVALQQDFFDKVFPNILPMAYTLLMYYFLRVKKAHPVLLIGVTFVLSIVCSAFGIL